jgi:cellulose synthase/poly-beta-1,6-N-acetylglucosamine synthase-like glycosyltransferase
LIDKPFEAWFNFIHVLPGAFSAYRMDAITKGNSKLLK